MTRTTASPPTRASAGGDFARLLETEERLEATVTAARAEAQRIMQTAQAEITARGAALDQELAESEKALPARIQERLRAGTEGIQSRARADIARYVGVSAERIATLARYVVDRLARASSP